MIFIIALAAALAFTIAFSAQLRKHPVPFYAAAVIISILIVYYTWQHAAFPEWFETWVWPVFARGALAGAMFVLVMGSTIRSNRSNPKFVVFVLMLFAGCTVVFAASDMNSFCMNR